MFIKNYYKKYNTKQYNKYNTILFTYQALDSATVSAIKLTISLAP